MAKQKINKVMVIGTLTEVDTQVRTTADGRKWIGGKIVVKVNQNEVESLVELRVLAFEATKNGGINKLYTSYTQLEGNLNKRVKCVAELREDSFVQADGSLRKYNAIYLKFINLAKNDEEDSATFEYSGFVTKEIYERLDSEDKLLGYRIEVAQSNYNDTNIQVLRFDIAAEDAEIYQAIAVNYLPGTTVNFSGSIKYVSHTEMRTREQAFGASIVEPRVISEKVYRITGGNVPFAPDDPTAYTAEEINQLIVAYKAADAEKIEKAKINEAPASSDKNSVSNAMSKLTKRSSLI